MVYMVTMSVYIFSGEFHGLYGNNDVCTFFQDTSSVYMATMMV